MLTTKALLLISHGLKNISYFVCFVGWFFCLFVLSFFLFFGLKEACVRRAPCASQALEEEHFIDHMLWHMTHFLRLPCVSLCLL